MSFNLNFNSEEGYKVEHHAHRAGEVRGIDNAYVSINICGDNRDFVTLYSRSPENVRAVARALEVAAMALERAIADSEKAKLVDDVLAKHDDPSATIRHPAPARQEGDLP